MFVTKDGRANFATIVSTCENCCANLCDHRFIFGGFPKYIIHCLDIDNFWLE